MEKPEKNNNSASFKRFHAVRALATCSHETLSPTRKWRWKPLPEHADRHAGAEMALWRVPSPDKQQDESVQTPLNGAEPDALDPHQLVGFILTQTADTATRHDPLQRLCLLVGCWALFFRWRRNLWLISSPFFLSGRSHVQTSAAALNFQHPYSTQTDRHPDPHHQKTKQNIKPDSLILKQKWKYKIKTGPKKARIYSSLMHARLQF